MSEGDADRAPEAAARPTVSVCIAVYNGSDLVERAVRSAEAQTVSPLEVIVVDDGSVDDTPRVLARLEGEGRVRAIRQTNKGVGGARNTAARAARGDWVAILDADDELDPRAIEGGVEAIVRTPGAGWCVSDLLRIDGEERQVETSRLPEGPSPGWLPEMLERNFLARTIMLRRAMLLGLGGYDETFRCYEDWELNIRMIEAGVLAAYAPGPLYRYHKTGGGITSNLPRLLKAFFPLYERHHRALADEGDPLYRHIYARRMWALGREFMDRLHDPFTALRCFTISLRYNFDLAKVARVMRRRLASAPPPRTTPGAEGGRESPPEAS